MFVLLIDAGNTRAKWRYLNNKEVQSEGVFAYADDLPSVWQGFDSVSKVWVASVTEQPHLQALLQEKYQAKVHWLHHPLASTGYFQHCYEHPERLGVDRWLAMLGARRHSQKAVLVVDAGTALTIDLMSADNKHEGGYIVPGVQMAQDALFNNTAKVKPFAGEQGVDQMAPGQNTYNCVAAGIQRQRFALVQSVINEFQNYQPFICGGDGQWLAQQLNLYYYNNLVLDGMESICVGSL